LCPPQSDPACSSSLRRSVTLAEKHSSPLEHRDSSVGEHEQQYRGQYPHAFPPRKRFGTSRLYPSGRFFAASDRTMVDPRRLTREDTRCLPQSQTGLRRTHCPYTCDWALLLIRRLKNVH